MLALLTRRLKGSEEPAAEDGRETDAGENPAEVAQPALRERLAPMLARLQAWWEGYDYEPPAEPEAEPAPPAAAKAPPPAAAPGWSPARRQVVQNLWGAGFSTPGEAEHVISLVKPLGLNEKHSILDLGAGLGGASRVIAESTGAWISGLEADAELAAAGMELSVMAGMAKKAPIQAFKPPTLGLRERSMDAVVSKEALYGLPDKEILFEELFKVLKADGQILFTDYLLPGAGTASEAITKWAAREVPTPMPWGADQTVARLKDIGFEVRICEDITDRLKHLVLGGWRDLVAGLTPGGVARETAVAIVGEAEIWCRRLTLFDANELRCYRVHALKHESNF